MAIIITLANQKGGVGKTTSTIELAACFCQREYKVLVVDLEQQADTTKYSWGNPKLPGVYEVLKGEVSITAAIQHAPEYDILTASAKLSNVDDEFNKPTDVLLLKKVLKDVLDAYDFIFIDTNPGRNRLLNMTYIASDYIIIPTDADEGSINAINSIFTDLKEYKEADWSDAEVLGVIFTRYENTGMHKYAEEKIREILNNNEPDAFLAKVRKGIAATECKTEGSSMQAGKKHSNPAIDYRAVADEIAERVI